MAVMLKGSSYNQKPSFDITFEDKQRIRRLIAIHRSELQTELQKKRIKSKSKPIKVSKQPLLNLSRIVKFNGIGTSKGQGYNFTKSNIILNIKSII